MKKSMLMSLLLLAIGSAYGAEGDTAKTEPVVPQGPTLEDRIGDVKGSVESLNETFLETKATVDKLAKIKLSGYVQTQWQYADSNGQASIAGGSFPANTKQRFSLRRARLKTTYKTATSGYVLQVDVAQTGLAIKDAYATLMEPWLKTLSATFGVFDRPFGYEISYSSSSRESPERSRVFQTLFPGERDLGAKLEIAPPPELGMLQYLNFKGGVFTGMRENAVENDNEQDLIGRFGFQAPFYDLNMAIDGGFSTYLGKVTARNDTVFAIGTGTAGQTAMVRDLGNLSHTLDRNYYGVDLQFYYDLPVIGGTSIRGEYLWGEQPGVSGNSSFYPGSAVPVYKREFMGWYAILVQNIFAKNQLVVKYDLYDPNVDAEGADIGVAGAGLTAGDLGYETLGLGWLFHWDENVRLMAYYDIVSNETVNSAATGSLVPFKENLDDNVLTVRAQVKF